MPTQKRPSGPTRFVALTLVLAALSLPAQANGRVENPALICDRAAEAAAADSTVPLEVLRAITRTETGRGELRALAPWPWTVNMEGQGVWFDTEAQAQRYVLRHFKRGARSFDIGCFQINYKWHGAAFASIEQMFDPDINARYAARFLSNLHRELGDWQSAVGAYHSRTNKYAKRYLARYLQIRQTLPALAERARAAQLRINRFPLLQGGAAQPANGSLVPLHQGGVTPFITAVQGG